MKATAKQVARARELAQENYETWGQYVVECCTDSELAEDLREFRTMREWVAVQKRVAAVHEERLAETYF